MQNYFLKSKIGMHQMNFVAHMALHFLFPTHEFTFLLEARSWA